METTDSLVHMEWKCKYHIFYAKVPQEVPDVGQIPSQYSVSEIVGLKGKTSLMKFEKYTKI